MKKTKKSIAVGMALVCIVSLSACGGNGLAQGENNPGGGTFTLEQIQDDPHAYLGEITLTGVVGSVTAHAFVLHNEAGTFAVAVEYRGSQAFPQVGDKVVVVGQLVENRPCCGGGFAIMSTQFEWVA